MQHCQFLAFLLHNMRREEMKIEEDHIDVELNSYFITFFIFVIIISFFLRLRVVIGLVIF